MKLMDNFDYFYIQKSCLVAFHECFGIYYRVSDYNYFFLFSCEQLSVTCLSGSVLMSLLYFISFCISSFNKICYAKTNWLKRDAIPLLVLK